MATDFVKTEEARATVTCYIDCRAPEELFADDWEDLSPAAQAWYAVKGHHLPCEGQGDPGMYCDGCRYANIDFE